MLGSRNDKNSCIVHGPVSPYRDEIEFYEILDIKVPRGGSQDLERETIPDRKVYFTRISMEGLADMHEYSKDVRLYRYLEFEPHRSLEDTRKYLQKLLDRVGTERYGRKFMHWFIRLLETNKVIGSIGLADIDFQRKNVRFLGSGGSRPASGVFSEL